MENTFEKYPEVEIIADGLDSNYKVKYIECVEEKGLYRFIRKERKIPKKSIESIVLRLMHEIESKDG